MPELPVCLVTSEPEDWILRRIACSFSERTMRFRAVLHNAGAPWTGHADCVFYSSWSHWRLQPRSVRALPSVALVTHIDRFAFRIASMARRPLMRMAFMSERYRRHVLWYCAPRENLILTPLGISPGDFPFAQRPARRDRIVVGIVGRLYPDGRKGESMLANILRDLDPGSFEILIVGQRWEDWIDSLVGPRPCIRYCREAPQSELAGLYAEMDAVLITSRREGGPIPALEALASGTPIISRPVGYVPDLLRALPEAGRLFHHSAQAVVALNQSRTLKRSLQEKRTEVARLLQDYTWEAFSARIDAALVGLLSTESKIPVGMST